MDKNPIEIYFNEIAKSKSESLSIQKEKELILLFRKGNRKALDELIKSNLKFVIKVAKRYQNQGLDLSDLINIGNKGLLTSIDSYDENKNLKLITYAVWWIRQHILVALANQSRNVRIPSPYVTTINLIRKTQKKLEQKYLRQVSSEEIAEVIKKPSKYVERHQIIDNPSLSLYSKVMDDSDIELIDLIPDKYQESSEDPELKNCLKILIEALKNEKDREIIKLYFGIDDGDSLTLDQLGEKYDLSKERVRQLKIKALAKLKKINNRMKLLSP
jgi:RNA polymerase primary sigma factor